MPGVKSSENGFGVWGDLGNYTNPRDTDARDWQCNMYPRPRIKNRQKHVSSCARALQLGIVVKYTGIIGTAIYLPQKYNA